MAKLISNPKECAYRVQVLTRLGLPSGIYVCKHSSTVAGTVSCYIWDKFPTNCPLPTGFSIQQIIKDHPLMSKRLLKPKTPYLEVGPLTHKELPKRRNRKDCIHYGVPPNFECMAPYRHYACDGVNCSRFEPKTK